MRWVWMPAIMMIHGTNEEFSTGSHAQYPPNESASYAQKLPIKMPMPKIPPENNDHFKPDLSHALSSLDQSPAMAYAKGTTVEANPKNNVGGCMVFQ